MTLQNYREQAIFHETCTETTPKILAMKIKKKMDLNFVAIYRRPVI